MFSIPPLLVLNVILFLAFLGYCLFMQNQAVFLSRELICLYKCMNTDRQVSAFFVLLAFLYYIIELWPTLSLLTRNLTNKDQLKLQTFYFHCAIQRWPNHRKFSFLIFFHVLFFYYDLHVRTQIHNNNNSSKRRRRFTRQ